MIYTHIHTHTHTYICTYIMKKVQQCIVLKVSYLAAIISHEIQNTHIKVDLRVKKKKKELTIHYASLDFLSLFEYL